MKGMSMSDKTRTKNISRSVIKDALSVAGGLYSMNARSAYGYVFNPNTRGTGVAWGMFVDYEDELNGETGFICKRDCELNGRKFKAGTLTDLISNEVINL
jgi:hypothetical protein